MDDLAPDMREALGWDSSSFSSRPCPYWTKVCGLILCTTQDFSTTSPQMDLSVEGRSCAGRPLTVASIEVQNSSVKRRNLCSCKNAPRAYLFNIASVSCSFTANSKKVSKRKTPQHQRPVDINKYIKKKSSTRNEIILNVMFHCFQMRLQLNRFIFRKYTNRDVP